jgi:hypothetical protein
MAEVPGKFSNEEIDALLSHVLSLRRDFVNELLRGVVPFSGRRKAELRGQLRQALDDGLLAVEDVLAFLAEREPAGKQHVFVYKVDRSLSERWRNRKEASRLLEAADLGELLDAELPLAMPETLTLSSIRHSGDEVEVTAVEARRYTEHLEEFDRLEQLDDGTQVEWRAYAQRIARSTATLKWHLATRTAELHITQATERGAVRDYYDEVVARFAQQISAFLDFSGFNSVNMHNVLYELGQLEQTGNPLTRSRESSFESPGGSNVRARSPSRSASVYSEPVVRKALGSVDTPTSGQGGNLYWLKGAAPSAVLKEDLHTVIVAGDARIHFMTPSSVDAIAYVLGQVRSLS